jgi:hypothetical protein
MSIMDRSEGMGPLDGPSRGELQLYPLVDGLRQRDVRRFRLGAVAA